MTFDEWWGQQNPEHLDKITAREAWDAAVEQSASVCDERAMQYEHQTANAENDDEVTELRSLAWRTSILAAEIRVRSSCYKRPAEQSAE